MAASNIPGRKMLKLVLVIVILILLFFGWISVISNGGGIVKSDIYFPTQREPGLPQMDALGHGWLVYVKGGLCVRPLWGFGTSQLIIWPYGYSYEVKGLEVRVLNGDGKVVARSGHWITFGGGPAVNSDMVNDILGKTIDEEKYPGPYFICGEVEY
jgi:hypothetical protein